MGRWPLTQGLRNRRGGHALRISLTGSTPSRCKVIFPSTSACNCGGIRRRVFYRCQPLETDEVSYLGTALGSSMAFPIEAYFGPGGGAGPRRDESWSLFLIGGGGE